MAYVRLSIVTPRTGEEERVLEIQNSLAEAVQKKEGCVSSFVIRARDTTLDVARITTFRDEASADASANDAHIMSLRSELHLAADGHEERAFETV